MDDSLLIFVAICKSGTEKESILISKVLHHSGKNHSEDDLILNVKELIPYSVYMLGALLC